MKRNEIINKIGEKYYITNIETGEFSYPKALKEVGKNIKKYQNSNVTQHQFLDIRFENERLAILVECKDRFSKWDKREIQNQLQEYVRFEKEYSDKKIVAILAETDGDGIWVWYGQSVIIDDTHKTDEKILRTFEGYDELCFGKVNDKLKVVDSIKYLNEILHSYGVNEKLRSQFVGTCLLALKNGLSYKEVKETIEPQTGNKLSQEKVVIRGIKEILEGLLARCGSLNRAEKLSILNSKVLDDQDISRLKYKDLKNILSYIDDNVVPYINDKNTAGQDLLNLFFTTFNKYVGKSDKNQAFTPDHICDFMSKVVGVNKHSRVLDPCCGSGAFLVRAMTDAMDDCDTEEERENVKRSQIYGIEFEDGAFGLSSTNMLIHGDGNSNVVQDSMFNRADWIKDANINVVLMNPPYNATKICCNPEYTKKWGASQKEDPSKGFHFVEWVCDKVSKPCKVAVLLPMQAAIGNSNEVKEYKKRMLEKYTLDAVFSLPSEVFYPGASAVACCMIFDLSQNHSRSNKETFFGYFKNDKFIKRKGLGRVETVDGDGNSLWSKAEDYWLTLYRNKKEVAGMSVMHKVSSDDEWLAEAYMETDYTHLCSSDFQLVLNNYIAYLIKCNKFPNLISTEHGSIELKTDDWREFLVEDLFRIEQTKGGVTSALNEGEDIAYISAKHEDNGFDMLCSKAGIEDWVSKGNCIIFVQLGEGSCGYANYSYDDFIGMSGKTSCGYIDGILNPYIGVFLATILSLERPKHSFGRSWTGERLKKTKIRLPVLSEVDNSKRFSKSGYIPDWQFMEDYIKSLPYGDRLVM